MSQAYPLSVNGALSAAVGLIDTLYMAHVGVTALAGVSIAATLVTLVQGSTGGFIQGYQIRLAHIIDRSDEPVLVAYRRWAIRYCIVRNAFGIVLLAGAVYPIVLAVTRGHADVASAGALFVLGRLAGMVFSTVTSILVAEMTVYGESRRTRLLGSTVLVGNVVFDYLFIVVLGLGPLGAGVATSIAAFMGLAVIASKHRASGAAWSQLRAAQPAEGHDSETLRVSTPLVKAFALDALASVVVFSALGFANVTDTSMSRVALTVVLLNFAVMSGFSSAAQVLCSRAASLGFDAHVAVASVRRTLLVLGVALAGCSVPVLLLVRLVNPELTTGSGLWVQASLLGLNLLLMGSVLAQSAVLRAARRTDIEMKANVLADWAVRIPATLVLAMFAPGIALLAGYSLYWLVRAGLQRAGNSPALLATDPAAAVAS